MQDSKKIKSKFYLGPINKRIAYLHIRRSHSNVFMTLTDCRGRVIICKTAAAVLGKSERRRRRKAPQTIEYMIASFENYFTLYNIWGIKLVVRIRPGQFVANISQSLLARKIFLLNIFNRRKLPYSFTRGRRKKY